MEDIVRDNSSTIKNQIIMEESKEQQAMHRFLQFAIYLSVALDILMFIYAEKVVANPASERYGLSHFLVRMAGIAIYHYPIHSKLFTLTLICLVSIGTFSRKEKDLNPKNAKRAALHLSQSTACSSCLFQDSFGFYIEIHREFWDLVCNVFYSMK